jgi:hypothetical protein
MNTETTSPRFEDMSREESIALQPGLHSKLRHARSAFADARRRAYHGERIDPAELAALEERGGKLSRASQRLQTELALRAAMRKADGPRVDSMFVDIARRELPPDEFYSLLARDAAAVGANSRSAPDARVRARCVDDFETCK